MMEELKTVFAFIAVGVSGYPLRAQLFYPEGVANGLSTPLEKPGPSKDDKYNSEHHR